MMMFLQFCSLVAVVGTFILFGLTLWIFRSSSLYLVLNFDRRPVLKWIEYLRDCQSYTARRHHKTLSEKNVTRMIWEKMTDDNTNMRSLWLAASSIHCRIHAHHNYGLPLENAAPYEFLMMFIDFVAHAIQKGEPLDVISKWANCKKILQDKRNEDLFKPFMWKVEAFTRRNPTQIVPSEERVHAILNELDEEIQSCQTYDDFERFLEKSSPLVEWSLEIHKQHVEIYKELCEFFRVSDSNHDYDKMFKPYYVAFVWALRNLFWNDYTTMVMK